MVKCQPGWVRSAGRCESGGGGGRRWAGARGPRVASGGQVARRGPGCAETEPALLRPARAAHVVTFKCRALVGVLTDENRKLRLRGIEIKSVLQGHGD